MAERNQGEEDWMSAGVIVAIAVGALLVIGVLAALVMHARSDARALERRRTEAATARRDESERRSIEADRAERRARLAQAEAEQHRAESRVHAEQADAYEQGLADDRLPDEEGAAEAPAPHQAPEPQETRR
jgi:cell division protein FtsN